jgi:hypothetical protein
MADKSISQLTERTPVGTEEFIAAAGGSNYKVTASALSDYTMIDVKKELTNYVAKVVGKGLSTEDFSTELKTKLEGLSNYDDSAIIREVGSLKEALNTLVSGNASTAIDNFNEIVAFLKNIDDSETLEGIIAGLTASITAAAKSAATAQATADANAESIKTLLTQVADVQGGLDTLTKNLGWYGGTAAEELTLELATSNAVINTSGAQTDKNGYGISKPVTLTQGNIYLIKAQPVDSAVSLFARISTETVTERITYSYTYTEEGQFATATADYDPSLVYTYNYTEDGTLESITDASGRSVSELPTTRSYEQTVYNPLFKTGAIATPLSGYYVYFCPIGMDIVVSANTTDLQTSSSDAARGKMYGVRYGVFASIASNYVNRWERDELEQRIDALEQAHEADDYKQSDYCVGAWAAGAASPESYKTYGDKSVCFNWHAYLIDTTDNTRTTTKPVGQMQPKNWLRFDDGTFAPAIGITEAQRAECDVELYLDSAAQNKYCDAGEFNAETFYNKYGMAKLYNAEGAEVRVLRPWETTETKYSFGVGYGQKMYLLDNVVGNSGIAWKGVFLKPTVWDGIDVSQWGLERTAICPSPVCTVGKQTRAFMFLYKGESNCQSAAGLNNISHMFDNDRTYPRVSDMAQVNNMTYARANNADTTAPYPCAEGGYHALNTFLNCVEVGQGTKYLHAASLYSSGISSNDTCNSEATWKANGGVRYRVDGGNYLYNTWGGTPSFKYNDTGSSSYWSNLLNQTAVKTQCMEAQMAYSFAQERGIAEGVEFEFYGATYWYVDVPTDADGLINARVYKRMSETFTAYAADGSEVTVECDAILRVGLYNGCDLSGDVFAHWGGGYEQVGIPGEQAISGSNSVGNQVDLYIESNQLNWATEKSIQLAVGGTFSFQGKYKHLLQTVNLANNYAKARAPFTAWKTENGGNLSTYECWYGYSGNYWAYGSAGVVGKPTRIAARFRGTAIYGNCSARFLYAYNAASAAYRYLAGSAQFLIE